ncbi:Prolipoprotein diacylglyceryl transferase [Tenacibaculum sp. MAR_2009_124]|uniref:prolipoprotein diacylglyceryl transferase n=1 Tax=Tenacibaculum sp. MAR_2009_124 TaxID=1250059 RepID=UPI0008992445|nr:prolipoprotein diacylglyceryl transferase [Tenacibaculum sp. MAR_2009_124]SED17068.1 Prolipoprotein diacylglyceryl transferase [Tenacibaculum sp. MAR_2009_124]
MFPKLFEFQNIIVYTYAFCVVLGTLLSILYTKRQAKRERKVNLQNSFFYLIFIAGFIGGKLFLFFEKPFYYIQNPENIINIFSGGFVFYGSFLCCVFTIIWYLKKHKIPVLPMLDILAVTTTIVHVIGRMGCFFAGCCFGKPTDIAFGMVFPKTNNITVHPSQLYEVFSILLILITLLIVKQKKQFNGQVFLLYVSFYAIIRGGLEIFRGDKRGFIIENCLSHSQFIALCLLVITGFFYFKLKNKNHLI